MNKPPQKLQSWALLTKLSSEAQVLADTPARLKKNGLMRGHIMKAWVEHRVWPLQARALPLYKYTGPEDPVRVSQEELGSEGVDDHLSFLVGPNAITDSQKKAVKPFSADLPPGSISASWLYVSEDWSFHPLISAIFMVQGFVVFKMYRFKPPLLGKEVSAALAALMTPAPLSP